MLTNYFKVALRTLRRRKGYAFINVAGLALGLAGCLLIGLYVRYELSYDRHHADAERVFRVVQHTNPEGTEGMAWVGGAMGAALRADFPQIASLARLLRESRVVEVERGGEVHRFEEPDFAWADPTVFDVFSLPFVEGDAAALDRPGTVVLTETTARKYFGDENPLGRTLTVGKQTLTVAGVIEDLPSASHIQFGLLTSIDTFKLEQWGTADAEFQSYWWPNAYTYVRLRDDASAEALAAALPAFIRRHRDAAEAAQFVPALQPLESIHLHSDLGGEWQPGGDATTVTVFGLIALFVLGIACVNFMNLATARAAERAREVGVRKTVGARRGQLVAQHFGESLLLSALALGVAVALVAVLLPFFGDLAGRPLALDWRDPGVWGWTIGAALAAGLLAGSYPAVYLSSFRPAAVLKGGRAGGAQGERLRQGLVLFQFTLSVALIAATVVAWQQLAYLQSASLGFDEEHVVVVQNKGADAEVLAERLRRVPGVVAVAEAERAPGFGFGGAPQVEHPPFTPAERLSGEGDRFNLQQVGFGYFDLFGIDLVAGRTFDADHPADLGVAVEREENFGNTALDGRAFVVNEAFVRAEGWTPEEALGRELRLFYYENGTTYMDHRGAIVGVVRDFHAASFRYEIDPLIFTPTASPAGTMARTTFAKVQPGDAAATMAALEAAYAEVNPERAFEAAFLDADLDARYRSERRVGTIIAVFALFAVAIACLGLFGLAAYAAERRTKEIGVRKTLGATTANLVALLSRDFVLLVAAAAAVATPLAWLAMDRWLDAFAYRIEIRPGLFLAVGMGALALALLTVSGQALRAARRNPTDALRYE